MMNDSAKITSLLVMNLYISQVILKTAFSKMILYLAIVYSYLPLIMPQHPLPLPTKFNVLYKLSLIKSMTHSQNQ